MWGTYTLVMFVAMTNAGVAQTLEVFPSGTVVNFGVTPVVPNQGSVPMAGAGVPRPHDTLGHELATALGIGARPTEPGECVMTFFPKLALTCALRK
jgi:hypothetical protein